MNLTHKFNLEYGYDMKTSQKNDKIFLPRGRDWRPKLELRGREEVARVLDSNRLLQQKQELKPFVNCFAIKNSRCKYYKKFKSFDQGHHVQ